MTLLTSTIFFPVSIVGIAVDVSPSERIVDRKRTGPSLQDPLDRVVVLVSEVVLVVLEFGISILLSFSPSECMISLLISLSLVSVLIFPSPSEAAGCCSGMSLGIVVDIGIGD